MNFLSLCNINVHRHQNLARANFLSQFQTIHIFAATFKKVHSFNTISSYFRRLPWSFPPKRRTTFKFCVRTKPLALPIPNKTRQKFKIWNSKTITVLLNVTSCIWRTNTDKVEKPTVSILWIGISSTVKRVAAGYSETSLLIYQVSRRHNQKYNNLHIHYRHNLKSGIKFFVMKMSWAGLSASFSNTFHLPPLYIPEQAIKFHIPTVAKGHLNIRLL
jgi:hypothetical protein